MQYTYDQDSRLVSQGGSFARTNLPLATTAAYSNTNQITSWNGATATSDPASNLTHDPATLATYAWDSRNQLTSVSAVSPGLTATYDALSRRRIASSSGVNVSELHDGSTVVRAASSTDTKDMLTVPGSGEVLAFTDSAALKTWVPIHDGSGSTIAHVDSTGSLANQYTYDPAGASTVTGVSIPDPFLFGGLEQDPTGLYFASGGYYSSRLERAVSGAGVTGASGGGGGLGGQAASTPGGSGGLTVQNAAINTGARLVPLQPHMSPRTLRFSLLTAHLPPHSVRQVGSWAASRQRS